MNKITFSSNNNFSSFNRFETEKNGKEKHKNSNFIKQKIHDTKIDKFFWTDIEAPKKRTSVLSVIGSFLGVMTPVIFFAKKQNPEMKIKALKDLGKLLNVDYKLTQILSTGLGGVIGGLLGGLLDRKEKNKIDKLEEGSYQLMNIAFPAILVDKGIKICKKIPKLNNNIAKLAISALGIVAGAGTAVIASNKLDDLFFDKYLPDEDRKFKKKDFIVHIDDVLGALVLAKFPLADKLHIDKILPLIYTWSGYHVGDA